MRMKKTLKILWNVNWLKTLWFNLHYLPFKVAVMMPVFVYRHTCLSYCDGVLKFEMKEGGKSLIKRGLVRIGPHYVGIIDRRFNRTLWELRGTLIVHGPCEFGSGSKISIGKNAVLSVGSNFHISGGSSIICQKRIDFGDDCLLSWDIQVMDTDFHKIKDENGKVLNAPRPIQIGEHVWIGSRSTIMKGVSICDGSVIAVGSAIVLLLSELGSTLFCFAYSIKNKILEFPWKMAGQQLLYGLPYIFYCGLVNMIKMSSPFKALGLSIMLCGIHFLAFNVVFRKDSVVGNSIRQIIKIK